MGSEEWKTWKSDRSNTHMPFLEVYSHIYNYSPLPPFIWGFRYSLHSPGHQPKPSQITGLSLWTALKGKTSIPIRDQKQSMSVTKQYFQTCYAPMQLPPELELIEV